MVIVSELLDPEPSDTWTLVHQAGVNHAVALLPGAEQNARWLRSTNSDADPAVPVAQAGERPWDRKALEELQQLFASGGFQIAVIEDTAPMDRIRLGLDGRDEEIGWVIDQIRAMGECGIPVLCYNWMALSSWARTKVDVELRGGALTTEFDLDDSRALPELSPAGAITEDQLWDALEYFLRAVVPVAEEAGVRLGLHPDDPPLPLFRGVPRIIRSIDAYRRVLDIVDSPANSITLCQGNVTLMTDDLPSVIREFGTRDRIAFVHYRDVAGDVEHFTETFHDGGRTDMAACMHAYRDVGFRGPLRPDHVPTMHGEDNAKPGYATLGRLFALGFIAGMREAVYGERPSST